MEIFLAFNLLFIPVLLLLAGLIFCAIRFKSTPPGEGFLTLGRRRIIFGYLGAALATLIYAYMDTHFLVMEKIELGHIKVEEFPRWVFARGSYLFIVLLPFVFFSVTVIGMPLFAFLSRIGMASLLGVVLIAPVLSLIDTGRVYLAPYNSWCQINLNTCLQKSFVADLTVTSLIALGFGLAARLPIITRRTPK